MAVVNSRYPWCPAVATCSADVISGREFGRCHGGGTPETRHGPLANSAVRTCGKDCEGLERSRCRRTPRRDTFTRLEYEKPRSPHSRLGREHGPLRVALR